MYVRNKGITAENISFLRKLQEYYCDLNNKDGCLCPDLFLFGWSGSILQFRKKYNKGRFRLMATYLQQYSSVQKKYSKGRFRLMATYLQQ